VPHGGVGVPKESVSLDVKRAFPFGIDGWTRPGGTARSTAVPGVLLTRKRSQVQTLSRPPQFSLAKALSAAGGQRSARAAAAGYSPPNPGGSSGVGGDGTTRAQRPRSVVTTSWSSLMVGHLPRGCLAGPVSTYSVLGSPTTPAGTLALDSVRGRSSGERCRRRDAGHTPALGLGSTLMRASHGNATPSPCRQARCRQATTPADTGHIDPPRPIGATRHTEPPVQPGADRAAAAPRNRRPGRPDTWSWTAGHRTAGHRTRGRWMRGRWTSARPVGRTSSRPDRTRRTGSDRLAGIRTSSRSATAAGRPDLARVTAPRPSRTAPR
jgi:hypothetical protein